MRSDSLAFRLIAGAALWSAIALLTGGLVLSTIFRNSVENSFDARLNVLLHSLIATTEIGEDGNIDRSRALSETRFDLAYSGWYWQIWPVAARPALRSRSLFDQSLDLTPAERTERNRIGLKIFDTIGPENQPLRVVERRVTLPGYDVPVSFAVAGDRAEMDVEIQGFNTWLFVAMAAMGAGLLVALLIQVRFGLRPLERVRHSLAQIRSGRATKLEGEFPLEIEPLAAELNGLLEGNREVLERARTHVGNLAHALKTPLSVLTNEARSRDDPFGETVSRMALQMREQIDHHLARARMAASANVLGAHTPVAPVLTRIVRALERIYAERDISIEIDCPEDAGFRGEAQDLEEVAGNLLDNACKWANTKVRLTVVSDGTTRKGRPLLLLRVEDDGPGLPEDARMMALKRGTRLDETKPGSGLGLSIVTEIADLYGGELRLETSPLGGLKADLYLPASAART
ncbi:integral membrane sensor signal transduction histidine kinase [Parvibaculum lavamentivorans DS-1]|uniref:histidine kinase n=1 Tax=Parvibaculum lavamentivorans (strain DS-1 / DSM 13023 / NCIMB 13966) TaxID=402881 RepID=A7HRL9_PARL1|nr:ATP-binding protein [Parvibaculum lavamentivorans]ABS62552.1 integral membrane sensor signal transduction histidine kinase [Parvibaculum lavamentivorans DS-1]